MLKFSRSKPHKLYIYFPKPPTEVYCFWLNSKISKSVHWCNYFCAITLGKFVTKRSMDARLYAVCGGKGDL